MLAPLFLYHGGCFDGFCAAWVWKCAFPDYEFVPVAHGCPPPDVKGRAVVIADFSYKRDAMKQLYADAHRVTVLDHHVSAEKELAGLVDELRDDARGAGTLVVHFDNHKSGARLTWEHLYNDVLRHRQEKPPIPWLVEYTEDRDLWRWKLPHSKEINAALRTYPQDFGIWDTLASHPPDTLIAEGAAILRAEQLQTAMYVKKAREVECDGRRVLCVNASSNISEVGHELAQGRPFSVTYYDGPVNRKWSLRSTPDGVDVSEIARKFGGGGHKHASGFETDFAFLFSTVVPQQEAGDGPHG